MEKSEKLQYLAFKKIDHNEKEKNMEKVVCEGISLSETSLQYEEMDFILAREISGDIRENSALKMLSVFIVKTYLKINNEYYYVEEIKPPKELTIPFEGKIFINLGVYNDGRDNIDYNLIMCVNDIIQGPKEKYEILELIGQGISGQVFKCLRESDQKYYAIKIIKNKKAYKNQALIELKILEFLNNEVDKQDLHHIIRLFDHFVYKEHLCIIFELLNENLYELLKQNYFQGISFSSIRFIIKQILEAVYQLQKANLIHCDLKPENILLKIEKDSPKNDILIKITDFGSACFKNYTMYQYIQSRYYRAPEVLLGCGYSHEIDMWSIGCIAAELYLGEPLLPGSCEYDQLYKIVHLIHDIPERMLKEGRNSNKYFTYDPKEKRIRIKTIEEYYKEFPNDAEPKYEIPLGLSSLDELVIKTNNKKNLNTSHSYNYDLVNELECFVHFLKGLLTIDPKFRWNAKQALRHPFITKERFDGHYNPMYEDVSHLYFNSVDNSHFSDFQQKGCGVIRGNANLYHSMMINFNPYASCNYSQNMSNMSLNNSLQDISCYQYNIKKIPMQLLKNFPYAKIDELNLKPQANDNKYKHNKYKNINNKYNGNNTYMITSHDEIYSNNNSSFTSDHNFYNQKKRKFKDNKVKGNKYSQMQIMNGNKNNFNLINQLGSNNAMMLQNNLIPGFTAQIKSKRNDSSHNTNSFYQKNINNYTRDYEGLGPTTFHPDLSNRSIENLYRARSKSDYNQMNQQTHQSGGSSNLAKNSYISNNLNMSNYSTQYIENVPKQNNKSLFMFGNVDTPNTFNKKALPDKKETHNGEIAEEELNEEEFFNNFKIIK